MAHGGVVVRVSSKHQHGSTHYHSRVQVAEKSAVFKYSPSKIRVYVLITLISSWKRQDNSYLQVEEGLGDQKGV